MTWQDSRCMDSLRFFGIFYRVSGIDEQQGSLVKDHIRRANISVQAPELAVEELERQHTVL